MGRHVGDQLASMAAAVVGRLVDAETRSDMAPDARRALRHERMTLASTFAMARRGKVSQDALRDAMTEASRVAASWGVTV